MSYMNCRAAFASGISELSLEEVRAVGGGESPTYAVTGRGPNLSPPSARQVNNTASAVAAGAQAVAVKSANPQVKVAAEAVAVFATFVAVAAQIFED